MASFVPVEPERDGLFPSGRSRLGEARIGRRHRRLYSNFHLVSLVYGTRSSRVQLLTTRDKKLESWVKDSAFLGGAGKGEPTIVTPKQCE